MSLQRMRGMGRAHGPHGKHLTNQEHRWGNDNPPPLSMLIDANTKDSKCLGRGFYVEEVAQSMSEVLTTFEFLYPENAG